MIPKLSLLLINRQKEVRKFSCLPHLSLTILLVLVVSLVTNLITAAQGQSAYFRLVRTIRASETGISSPSGLVYFPGENALGVISAYEPSDLALVSIFREEVQAVLPLPISMAESYPIALPGIAPDQPQAMAFNPQDRHFYLLDPVQKKIFKVASNGQTVGFLDLSEILLTNPKGIAFAPSGDPTDDPEIFNLYIADAGFISADTAASGSLATNAGQILELSLTEPVVTEFALANLASSLVNITDTSQWSPPSPDPAGIVYRPSTDTLLVSDSEVNEMSIFEGKNFFEAAKNGNLLTSSSTTAFSDEPTGLGLNPNNGHIFISDDNGPRRVYEVDLGADGLLGTADDVVNPINTQAFGSFDPEDVAYGENQLFIADGMGNEVYILSPGANGIFDGVPPDGDDQVTSFDTAVFGAQDPEGIDYNPDSGTLFIVSRADEFVFETSISGALINTIDIDFLDAVAPAGIAYAPGSQNPSTKNLYIVDRGIDNGSDPNENDGKIYEITYLGDDPTATPSHTPLPSATPTASKTPLPTDTRTPTATHTPTATSTSGNTPQNTSTPVSTLDPPHSHRIYLPLISH